MQDAAVTEITSNPELYTKYLTVQGDNPTYSPGNIAMVIWQNDPQRESVKFATADRWGSLGRKVMIQKSKTA